MKRNRTIASPILPALVLAGAGFGLIRFLSAQEPAPAPSPQRVTINRYCVGCHNNRAKTGGLSLEGKSPDVSADPETWEKVVKKLQLGVMRFGALRAATKLTATGEILQTIIVGERLKHSLLVL